MNRPAQSADRPSPALPRPTAGERAAKAAADFDAGRRNPFASVDLSRLSPEARAKAERLQRERDFIPVE